MVCLPIFVNAQKIENVQTKERAELKEKVEMYCAVVLQPIKLKFGFFVMVNELGAWRFIDDDDKPLNFETTTAIMNHMNRHGWVYLNNIGGTDGAAPQFFFKKKE